MAEIFTLPNLFTFGMLTLLQAVLGFDNLLYISLESKRVEESQRSSVRRLGVAMAIVLRILLLIALVQAIHYFQDPFVRFAHAWFSAEFNIHSLIVLVGGAFIVYTAMKEIYHMLSPEVDHAHGNAAPRSARTAIFWIAIMNVIFSFDSILSAMALTENVTVMSAAIIASGLMMILLADHVSEFLRRNRMYEVLGLFILFIVGIMLVSEGGHLAHVHLFGHAVEPMTKPTFYFVLAVLVLVDVVQSRYQKKLLAAKAKLIGEQAESPTPTH